MGLFVEKLHITTIVLSRFGNTFRTWYFRKHHLVYFVYFATSCKNQHESAKYTHCNSENKVSAVYFPQKALHISSLQH